MLRRIFSGLLLGVSCVATYYVLGVLLLVPGAPGERYFTSWRMAPGIIGSIVTLAAYVCSAWLWKRAGSDLSLVRLTMRVAALAIALVALFWVSLALTVSSGVRAKTDGVRPLGPEASTPGPQAPSGLVSRLF